MTAVTLTRNGATLATENLVCSVQYVLVHCSCSVGQNAPALSSLTLNCTLHDVPDHTLDCVPSCAAAMPTICCVQQTAHNWQCTFISASATASTTQREWHFVRRALAARIYFIIKWIMLLWLYIFRQSINYGTNGKTCDAQTYPPHTHTHRHRQSVHGCHLKISCK